MAALGRSVVIGVGVALAASFAASAATPTATIAVSAVVTSSCDSTACRTIPRVVSFGLARGGADTPSFDLSQADQPVMTITY